MSNQRPSFAKRDREMKLKDKARAKAERRAARRAEARSGEKPALATDDAAPGAPTSSDGAAPDPSASASSAPPDPTRPR